MSKYNDLAERRQTIYTTEGLRLVRQRIYMEPHMWDILAALMVGTGETCVNRAIAKLILDAHRLSKVDDARAKH